MIAVLLNSDSLFRWQFEALERLQKLGNKIVLLRVSNLPNNNFSITRYLKLVFLLEAKILKSRANYLEQVSLSKLGSDVQLVNVDVLDNISKEIFKVEPTGLISFINLEETLLSKLAKNLNISVLKLCFAGKTTSDVNAIIQAYKEKAGTVNVSLLKFSGGGGRECLQYLLFFRRWDVVKNNKRYFSKMYCTF